MEDPIFDPWSVEAEERAEPPPRTSRWRSPGSAGSTIPATRPTPSPAMSTVPTSHPRARLAGTAGFLRSMATPRLEAISRRLRMARHETSLQDLLGESPALLRFEIRPRPGPLSESVQLEPGRLEVALEEGPAEHVVARFWLDLSSDVPSEQVRIATAKLEAAWIEELALHFVERVLSRA